jgi:prepilin-type N-terminal cleavage/methylation domain-containing protein
MSTLNNKKGFTLIEIVIVLAIAALILAGVLIAVSGAQTSRRDTQRKDDMGKMASYMEQYASNHAGAYPTTGGELTAYEGAYITPNNLTDPSGGAYTPALAAPTTGGAHPTVNYGNNFTCTNGVVSAGGGARRYALSMTLEQGGTYCVGN